MLELKSSETTSNLSERAYGKLAGEPKWTITLPAQAWPASWSLFITAVVSIINSLASNTKSAEMMGLPLAYFPGEITDKTCNNSHNQCCKVPQLLEEGWWIHSRQRDVICTQDPLEVFSHC